ncbi:hypothetical protein P4V47_24795 [Brevibacillus laterosporus]|uniref:hypothetical protein n=1 Tax=Brevibacillus laterosporus TaxID=1465 RepID=UPI002E1E3C7E|nr:hypothetical protein [Brevibacillus laterosporus]
MSLIWGDSHRDSDHARRIRKQKLRQQWFAGLVLKSKDRNVTRNSLPKKSIK